MARSVALTPGMCWRGMSTSEPTDALSCCSAVPLSDAVADAGGVTSVWAESMRTTWHGTAAGVGDIKRGMKRYSEGGEEYSEGRGWCNRSLVLVFSHESGSEGGGALRLDVHEGGVRRMEWRREANREREVQSQTC